MRSQDRNATKITMTSNPSSENSICSKPLHNGLRTMKWTSRLLVLAIALVIASGCEVHVDSNNYGWFKGRVRVTVPFFIRSASQSLSFDQISLLLSGNQTLANNGPGTATLSLYDSHNQIMASRNFAYIVQDGILIPSDYSAIEAWIGQYSGVSAYQVDLMNIPTTDDPGPGVSSMTMTAVYDGEELASSTTSWERNVCTLPPCYVDAPIE
jgi:hypothetical protein